MKGNILKIIVYILIIVGIYFLLKKFPDQMILICGIGLILIIGNWLLDAEKDNQFN